MTPTPFWAHAMRTDSGRPSSSMRFRTWTATSTSVARRSSVRERSPSPITRFHRPMVASARARFVYPDALCQAILPLSVISWRWRSRWVGAVSAVALGTAVARWHDDGRLGMALADAGVGTFLVIRPVTREGGNRTRDLVQQGADLRAIIHVVGGQRGRHDLAGVGIPAEVELSPGPALSRAVFL